MREHSAGQRKFSGYVMCEVKHQRKQWKENPVVWDLGVRRAVLVTMLGNSDVPIDVCGLHLLPKDPRHLNLLRIERRIEVAREIRIWCDLQKRRQKEDGENGHP